MSELLIDFDLLLDECMDDYWAESDDNQEMAHSVRRKIAALEAQLRKKDERIAELTMKTLNPEASRLVDEYTGRYKELQRRLSEVEGERDRLNDWDSFFNAFAGSQPIWPNDWCQEVAMVAYSLHMLGWRPAFKSALQNLGDDDKHRNDGNGPENTGD